MNFLYLLTFCGLSAVVWCNRCQVSDTDDVLHCGVYTNMNCTDIHYTPYCHRLYGQKEGVCTCEKFCVDVSECQDGCLSSRYRPACVSAFSDDIVKICRCQRTHH